MAIQKERRATPRKPASTKSDKPRIAQRPAEQPSPEDVRRRIEMTAYYKAKERGFAPGYELEDWLAAEREVKQRLQA
ncbi:MAG TPA: DUF2934 domain-containing protein [Burkholderiales bacterium]|nr:DUF2934 domain-containing protein [Burkholderiales bacterium]